MNTPFIRTAYNYDMDQVTKDTGLQCKDKSLAQQEYHQETDINYIAERYGLTGTMPQVLDLPAYGDYSGIFDFQTAQNAVIQGQQQFMTLPAKVRSKFDNDPQKLLEFLADSANRDEAIQIGLIPKPEVTGTTTPAAAPAPAPAPAASTGAAPVASGTP